jgi:hypothetical protein
MRGQRLVGQVLGRREPGGVRCAPPSGLHDRAGVGSPTLGLPIHVGGLGLGWRNTHYIVWAVMMSSSGSWRVVVRSGGAGIPADYGPGVSDADRPVLSAARAGGS